MLFEKASRLKLRFATNRGLVSSEDLWDLPLTSTIHSSLDSIARGLNKSIKESEEESFVVTRSEANTVLDLQFEIIKHVIKVRLSDNVKKLDVTRRKSEKTKIERIIATKEDASLENESIDDLKKRLSGLE